MNINSLSALTYNRYPASIQIKQRDASYSGAEYEHSFDILKSEQIKKEINMQLEAEKKFKSLINKEGRINKEDIRALGDYKKMVLKCAENYIQKKDNIYDALPPKNMALFALAIKECLDNNFGKDGYKIAAIGTSPDIIVNAMEFLGADAAHIPISGLRLIPKQQCPKNVIKNLDDYPNLKKILRYADKKGINKLQADDKQIIVIDIAHKGRTIKRFANLLTEYNGIDPSKITQLELASTLNEIDRSNPGVFDDRAVKKFVFSENRGITGELSNTPHFDIRDKNDIVPDKNDEELFKKFEKFSNPLASAYNLLVFNELEKRMQAH